MGSDGVMIGLEIHVQLTSLKTKLFCSCPADYRDKPPNTNVCPICLGFPGVLPNVNMEAIKAAIKLGLAFNSRIRKVVTFVRKHYFYPDLPKNYQITQFEGRGTESIAEGGYVMLSYGDVTKKIRIRRINIEEDPARITYPEESPSRSPYSLIDFNRSGIALLEIVTEPDIGSGKEARYFLSKLTSILEHLGICDPTLEGAVRVDVNVSVRGGERVEIKNIGSLKDVEKAVNYEISRQEAIVKGGGRVARETRHWDKVKKVTISARTKEFEEDYRYFPEPDIPSIVLSDEVIERIKSELPELPDERAERFVRVYGLSEYLSNVLTSSKQLADAFEETVSKCGEPKLIASIYVNELLRWVDELGLTLSEGLRRLNSERVCKLVSYLKTNIISLKILKELIKVTVSEGRDPEELIKEGLTLLSDESQIAAVVDEVMSEHPKAVRDALRDSRAINYLVGQVMKKTKGRADPKLVVSIIRRRLKEIGQ